MANSQFDPFVHRPSNTVHLVNGILNSHTVTSGYYARVVFSAWAVANANAYSSNTAIDHIYDSDSGTVTAEVWANAGDVISIFGTTAYNPTGTLGVGVGSGFDANATAAGRVDGNDVCHVEVDVRTHGGPIPSHTWTYEMYMEATCTAWIEEYPIPT